MQKSVTRASNEHDHGGQDRSEHDRRRKIENAIRDALKNSGYYALRRLDCEFDGRVVSLRGRVSTYYEMQIAQQIVLSRVEGNVCFDNQIKVTNGNSSTVSKLNSVTDVMNESAALFT